MKSSSKRKLSIPERKRILLLVETSNIYGRQIIGGISRYAWEHGNWSIFLEDRGLLEREPNWLRKIDCDGIISRTTDYRTAKILSELTIPLVELHGDGVVFQAEITCDPDILGQIAAEHFLERGLQHFGYFAIGYSWWSAEFGASFEKYLASKNFACETSPFCKRQTSFSLPMVLEKNLEHDVVHWIRSLTKPLGFLCPSDAQAVFLANICNVLKIGVPNEIAILGVANNVVLCNVATPPLSSIFVDGRKTGYAAAKLLDDKMHKRKTRHQRIMIAPSFVVTRQSTDFLAVSDPDLAQAAQFIRDNAALRISVEDVANHVCLSSRTLIRKFRQHFGHTPEREILRIKMQHAKMLLRETDLSVKEIGATIGYGSPEYFIKAFRRDCGSTPLQYRQSMLFEQ